MPETTAKATLLTRGRMLVSGHGAARAAGDTQRAPSPELLDDGWLLLRNGVIEAVGSGRPPTASDVPDLEDVLDVGGSWVLPGFVDLHNHGGGGRSLYSGEPDDVRIAARAHLEHGTTAMLASIGSATLPRMIAAARAIATVIDDGSAPNIVGIHFEGPFISPLRAGAQTKSALLNPDEGIFQQLLEAAGGHAAAMTVAPELPGACELIARHRDELVFALGHSDATAEQFQAGVEAGARQVTHLFNALPPLGHRSPGPIGRALLEDRLSVEIIADGHHLADDTMRLTVAASGSDRVLFVTDAMAAAGLGDGHYSFVDREVEVKGGAAYLAGTSTLAGSTLFIAGAVQRATSGLGAAMADAQRMSSANAARLMGWNERGRIAQGARADLVVLDDARNPAAVYLAGRRV